MDDDTPEARIEAFIAALEAENMALAPPTYEEGPQAFIADMRTVLAKARGAPA